MMKWLRFLISLIIVFEAITSMSCKTGNKSDNNPEAPDIDIMRFDQDFMCRNENIDSSFLVLYSTKIMEVGYPGSEMYNQFDSIFHTDKEVIKLYEDCQKQFSNTETIQNNLSKAFAKLHKFLPEMIIPKISMHISYFGESIVSSEEFLSAAIDKYLGKDYPGYKSRFQPYQSQKMYKEKIVSDYITGWLRSEFFVNIGAGNDCLLDYMIYEGKLLYLLKNILPKEEMQNLTGFNEEQLDWCMKNEKKMWDALSKFQHLYSADRLTIAKYIEDAPNTSFFPAESPGRAIIWNGYKIIESYMKNNKDVILRDLMLNNDSRKILSTSLYNP